MSYIPPSLRNKKNVSNNSPMPEQTSGENIFKRGRPGSPISQLEEEEEKQEAPDIAAEEIFPTLGEMKSSAETSGLDFASSLFNPQSRDEQVEKEIPDGWVRLAKNEEDFLYGDTSDDYDKFQDYLDEVEESRIYTLQCRMLRRHEEYREMDLFLNGPQHIHSWEVDDYIEELKAEQCRATLSNFSSDDTSDDDNSGNEFN